MKFYFAHNFKKRIEYRKIEKELEQELGIELFNPFYDSGELDEEKDKLNKDVLQIHFNDTSERAERLVKNDLTSLASCDALFTIIEEPSIGTIIELCNAKLMNKTIYVVGMPYCYHPWIKVYADFRFETVEIFKKFWGVHM